MSGAGDVNVRAGDVKGGHADAEVIRQKARRYFANPGFGRLLPEIWSRYASLERAGGHATVRRPTYEECEAINDFFGWSRRPDSDIRVPLKEFERELSSSAFPYTIPELHEVLTGKPLLTRSDLHLLSEREWRLLFSEARRGISLEGEELHPAVKEWLDGLEAGSASGYRSLKELARSAAGMDMARRELVKAARAWQMLLTGAAASLAGLDLDAAIRLPVLAALATGDAHALDRTEPAGRLLFQALASRYRSGPQNAEAEAMAVEGGRDVTHLTAMEETSANEAAETTIAGTLIARRIYREAGILDDDISSIVHLYQPSGRWRNGVRLHVLTLRQIEEASSLPPATHIYMVENPSIFSSLIDVDAKRMDDGIEADKAKESLLVCTSGPASAAALRLLDRLQEMGDWRGVLFYSGDFDIKGIEIGNGIANRYKDRFVAWRFDAASYTAGIRGASSGTVSLTNEERIRLSSLEAVWDPDLTAAISLHGRKLFQEQLLAQLLQDWRADGGRLTT